MASLTTSLYNAAAGLRAFQSALDVTENNVTNSSTPGYARQVATLLSRPFDPSEGVPGGVYAGPVQSTRGNYIETTVQSRQSASNFYNQQVADISTLQSIFDLGGASGLTAAMNGLFSSFSQLSVNPNDTVSRQAVLNAASTTANAFNQAATAIANTGNNIDANARSVIDQVNALATQIARINTQRHSSLDGTVDAGVDSQFYADLENLSQFVGFSTLQQSDGTISIYIGGQTPLVMGDTTFPIQGSFAGTQTGISDSNGNDITAQVTTGQLGALLNEKNQLLPSYSANLNSLASALADQVNTTLGGGVDQSGAAPPMDLFSYDPVQGAAYTMTVNPLTPDQLAAALPAAPGGNGNALALSQLANQKVVSGYTFSAALGNIGERIGADISGAQNNYDTENDLLSQAQNVRNQISGVSLDQEAMTLMQYQQGYEAVSKMLGIVSQMTDTVMGMFQPQ